VVETSDGRGGSSTFTIVSLALLVVGALGIAIAAGLLAQTMIVAQSLNDKATVIAKNGRGINIATDSVIQLNRTNQTASSILASAQPLEGLLNQILGSAKEIDDLGVSINGLAGTINGTATTINGTATTINGTATTINGNAGKILVSATEINDTAKSINGLASSILDTANLVRDDVKSINSLLDRTLDLAKAIKGDTGNILEEAKKAARTSGCIAEKIYLSILGSTYDSPDCPGGRGPSLIGP